MDPLDPSDPLDPLGLEVCPVRDDDPAARIGRSPKHMQQRVETAKALKTLKQKRPEIIAHKIPQAFAHSSERFRMC